MRQARTARKHHLALARKWKAAYEATGDAQAKREYDRHNRKAHDFRKYLSHRKAMTKYWKWSRYDKRTGRDTYDYNKKQYEYQRDRAIWREKHRLKGRRPGSWTDWVPFVSTAANIAITPEGERISDYAKDAVTCKQCVDLGFEVARHTCEMEIAKRSWGYMMNYVGVGTVRVMEDLALSIIVKRAIEATVAYYGIKGAAASFAGPAGWALVADGAVNGTVTIVRLKAMRDAAKDAQSTYCDCDNVVE
jgi:hypothetical protein